jgi:site-specific recombinase XerD
MQMKVFSNLTINYRLRAPKPNSLKTDQVIYCRIYLDDERADFSTKQKVASKAWCKTSERLKVGGQQSETINFYLDGLTTRIVDLYLKCRGEKSKLNLTIIKKVIFTQKDRSEVKIVKKNRGLDYVIDQYIKDLIEKQRVGLITHGTYKGYKSSIKSLHEYSKGKSEESDDTGIEQMDKEFFYQFEKYLLTVKKMNKNSTHKVLKHSRRMFNYAFNNGWIDTKPEIWINVKYVNPPRPLLTIEEIKSLKSLNLGSDIRLIESLDSFIFQIFTGLSYQEVKSLRNSHIKNIDGRSWIIIKRKKTGNEQKLILLPDAHNIIEKYKNNQYCQQTNQVIPVKSNQKYNESLKIIQSMAGIETKLTSHLGRHVFATTIALSNGMPLVTLSKILGHSSVKTTQIYAKVLDDKIAKDFDDLSVSLSLKL